MIPPAQAAEEGSGKPSRSVSLRKYEILRRKKVIARLFETGEVVKVAFLRAKFAVPEEMPHHRGLPCVMFAVSKRVVKNASKRNRIKRLLREAYRMEKAIFLQDRFRGILEKEALCIAFIYQASRDEIPEFREVRSVMGKCLSKICSKVDVMNG
ncbi:MAG: ribonuclease P protein component [Chlorobiales bacterium]|nr:ribonuclease P protein component [Chlorobiales bacterium]